MEETTFKIELTNGTEIIGNINGNNYITQQTVTEDMLKDSLLIGMKINGIVLENQTCCNLWTESDGTHIIFREKTETDFMKERLEEYESAIVELAELITEV